MGRLAGQTVLVVDGDTPFGRAAALALAGAGARVAVGGRTEGAGEATAADVGQAGGMARAVTLDPLDEASCAAAVAAAEATLGPLDVLCNTVIRPPAERALLHETSVATWRATIAATVTATALPTRHALRGMKRRGRGAVILVASSAALVGVPGLAAFSAGAGALVNLTRGLARDVSGVGVRVNCLCLGGLDRPLAPGERETATFAPVTPEEVADALLFLASDDSRALTGQVVAADHGLSAWR